MLRSPVGSAEPVKTNGLANLPTGARNRTYTHPDGQKAARYAAAEKAAIDSANPNDSMPPQRPCTGVQFAAITDFQRMGLAVSQQVSPALAGKMAVNAALKAGGAAAERDMKQVGYFTVCLNLGAQPVAG